MPKVLYSPFLGVVTINLLKQLQGSTVTDAPILVINMTFTISGNKAISPDTEVIVCCKMDELRSYVKSKHKPRWLFYSYDRIRRKVIAHVFGPRTKKALKRLMVLLALAP
ncbi:transposase [Xenorhabdus vietnamensis]|uniref:Transposase n=1 Tax=Xenorhabdus vietnamensis TaxID=351656 RepID=A0A1Y2SC71_9GAMM|nr:IS1 family transposase [Xenorhabdus vietnamensis]OTA16214.1 transposase [Xenorhabdus vietnamensis]